MAIETKVIPSVSVTYARNGASTKAKVLGMRPPASGKSRALFNPPGNDTERLEKLFELYTQMTAAAPPVKGGKRRASAKHAGSGLDL